MREGIHPNYKEIEVVCSCGNQFKTRSAYAKEKLQIEICSECHPFYKGTTNKLIDTEGRLEKFKRKYDKLMSKDKQAASEQ